MDAYAAALTGDAGGTRITVRVVPRATANAVGDVVDGALRVRITAPPVEGKANAAVVRLLADVLGVRRSDVAVVTGTRSRTKVVAVSGLDPQAVGARLARG